MKIVVAQDNAKFIQSFQKGSFRLVVLNNLRNIPWIAPIACANFSLETGLQSKLQTIKPIVSKQRGDDCLV